MCAYLNKRAFDKISSNLFNNKSIFHLQNEYFELHVDLFLSVISRFIRNKVRGTRLECVSAEQNAALMSAGHCEVRCDRTMGCEQNTEAS